MVLPSPLNDLVMNKVICESPRIIFHPHSLYYLSKYRHYITPKGVFHSCTCHVKPSDIDYDSVDQYKVFNPSTGETRPMFLVVRCGKCILCRQRKLSQWCFRCLREANQSKMLPFFLTLTYNDKHLPTFGLYKRDIQLFLKRLRRSVERMYKCLNSLGIMSTVNINPVRKLLHPSRPKCLPYRSLSIFF